MVEDELFLECVKQAWGIRGDIKKEDLKKITASWVNKNKIKLSHLEEGKEYASYLWSSFIIKFGGTPKLGSLQIRLRVAEIYGFADLVTSIREEIKIAQVEKQEREKRQVQEEPFPIERVMEEDELFLECVKQAWGIRGDIKKEDLKKITASWVNKNKIKLSHLEEGKEYASYLWSSFIIKFGETPKLGSLQIRLRVAEIYGFADLVTSIREEIKIAQVEKQEREKRQVQEEPFPIERVMVEDELFLECVKQAWGIRGDIKKEDLKKITASWVNRNKIRLSHPKKGKKYASYLWRSFIIKFGETPKLGSLQIRLRVAEIYGFADLVMSIREEIKIAQVEKQEREKRKVQEEPFPIERVMVEDELFLECVKQALGIKGDIKREDLRNISSTYKDKNKIKLSHPEKGKEYALGLWQTFLRKFGKTLKLGSLQVRLRVAEIYGFVDLVEGISSEYQKREKNKVQEEPFPIERVMVEDELFLECVKQALGIKGEIKREDLMNISSNCTNKNKIKLSHLEEGKEYAFYLWKSFINKFGKTLKLGSLQVRLRVAEIYGFVDLVTSIREEIKIAQVEKQDREKRQV